ncbi:reverse transcriptase domain-containing protein [Tanacetum coccineum]|uniref:Reverse transcriptase domain-containing protein n=1 Tax=Tanacetum coccineum TaxID=301880 RepID=A0ABQ5G8G1_9ASTR
MVEGDEDKIAFFVGEGVFCYGKMPFGLKNERATYQRLVDKFFSKQIGRNLEAYVDDMVIKSTSKEGMLSDIQETFERKRETLIMYLAASKESINVALLQKEVKGRSPSTSKKVSKILSSSHDNGSHSSLVLMVQSRIMLIDPTGKEYTYALRFEFETTNNEVEYEALLAGLCIAQEMEITKVAIFLDSQLVGFEGYTDEHVRRNQNKKADALSKLASMTFEHLTKVVLVEVLAKRSIEEKEVLEVEIKEKRSWISPIQEYLLSGLLPEDTKEARKIRIQVP